MATKRIRQKETRARRLLQAAEDLFTVPGYAETGVAEVTDRAGLAVGTFYNYYASKGDLLAAFLREGTDEILSAVEASALQHSTDAAAAVSSALDVVVDLVTRQGRGLWREVLAAALAHPDTVGRRLFAADVRIVGLLTELIRKLQERGLLRPQADPGRSAIALYGAAFVWMIAYVTSDDVTPETLRSEIRRSVDIVVRGISRE